MGVMLLLSIFILLTCFMLVANRKVEAYISTFRLQSFLVAVMAISMLFEDISYHEKVNIVIVCFIILALKVIYIPRLLKKTSQETKYSINNDTFAVTSILEIICVGIVLFCNILFTSVFENLGIRNGMEIANSLAVVFIGLLFMISRRRAIGQIVGFLVIENGMFLTAMYSTHGMPLIVDIGIFIDLITAVLIMGMMVFRIDKEFETTDTDKLNNLRG